MMRPGFMEEENNQNTPKDEVQPTIMESKKTQIDSNQTLSFDQLSSNVNFGMLNSEVFTNDSVNVKVAEPRDFDDAEVITEAIKANKTVIMFLDGLDTTLQQRIIDYIGGYCAAYGIKPEQMRTGWVIDPKHKRTQSFR